MGSVTCWLLADPCLYCGHEGSTSAVPIGIDNGYLERNQSVGFHQKNLISKMYRNEV